MRLFDPATKRRTTNVAVYIAEDVPIYYHVNVHFENIRFDGLTIEVMQLQYLSRRSSTDSWPVLPLHNFCGDRCVEFHAMLHAGANLLAAMNGRNQVYEDDHDIVYNLRHILQHVARQYQVDVNHMVAMWPDARIWLNHTDYPAPLTIDELIGNLKRQGKAVVKS